ncbi:TPA: hypothetical protein ACJFUB_001240 [Yersinia enterocolitica]|nr:hypothetical protein [Yersinia enterocolitica]
MKKPFDNFTVERLEEIIAEEGYSAIRTPKNDEVRALARIALAARRAEPVGYLCEWDNGNQVIYYGEAGNALDDDWSSQPSVHKNLPIYTTPQLNSPEISEGWPTEDMVIAGFESKAFDALIAAVVEHQGWPYSCRESAECVTGIFKAMLAAAPESNHD